MRDYSSAEYRETFGRKAYSNLEKRTVVTAIEQGRMTIREAQLPTRLKAGRPIREWIMQFKSEKSCIGKDGRTITVTLTIKMQLYSSFRIINYICIAISGFIY